MSFFTGGRKGSSQTADLGNGNVPEYKANYRYAEGVELYDSVTDSYYRVVNTYVSTGNATNDTTAGNLEAFGGGGVVGNFIQKTEKGSAGGVATLNGSGKVPSTQLPSYVDDVLEFTDFSNFPPTGEDGKIYLDKAANEIYRWSGTQYVKMSHEHELDNVSMLLNSFLGSAGGAKVGEVDPNGQAGWHYEKKAGDVSPLNKVNWYFYGASPSKREDLSSLKSAWGVVDIQNTSSLPFIVVYTAMENDGNDAGSWYRSRLVYTYTGAIGTGLHLFHTGSDPLYYNGLQRIPLTLDASSSEGLQTPGEKIFTISIQSNSAAPVGDVKFTVRNLGYLSNLEHEFILHAVETAAPDVPNLQSVMDSGSVLDKDSGVDTGTNQFSIFSSLGHTFKRWLNKGNEEVEVQSNYRLKILTQSKYNISSVRTVEEFPEYIFRSTESDNTKKYVKYEFDYTTGWDATTFEGALTTKGYVDRAINILQSSISVLESSSKAYSISISNLEAITKANQLLVNDVDARLTSTENALTSLSEAHGATSATLSALSTYVSDLETQIGTLIQGIQDSGNLGSGTTANRPTGLGASNTGGYYFDTTLGYRIDWNGTAWVNATGTVV